MKGILGLLLAGSFFFGLCSDRVKEGVRIDGVEVGGLPFAEAVERIRATHVRDPLVIHTPQGDVFAQLSACDDAEELVRRAAKGATLETSRRREWISLEDDLLELCERCAREGKDATLTLSERGFSYVPGEDAVVCDYARLVADAAEALRTGGTEITLSARRMAPAVTVETLKARTRLLARFSTSFATENAPRVQNIALAAAKISGTALPPGEVFSFNTCVGARTRERGFAEAPVIMDGNFVQGVGGGVCQVSTTLFGAALRAGLTIVESHPHSLSVGYVAPSQDAMVSSASDLKFLNPYTVPVYLFAEVKDGRLTCSVFGLPDGREYRVESRVLFTLDPPEEKIVEGGEDKLLRAPKQGIASESVCTVYEDGVPVEKRLIRRDTYACVQGIVQRAPAPSEGEGEEKT